MHRHVDQFPGRHNERPLDTVDQMTAIVAGVTNVHVAARAIKSVLPAWAQVRAAADGPA